MHCYIIENHYIRGLQLIHQLTLACLKIENHKLVSTKRNPKSWALGIRACRMGSSFSLDIDLHCDVMARLTNQRLSELFQYPEVSVAPLYNNTAELNNLLMKLYCVR